MTSLLVVLLLASDAHVSVDSVTVNSEKTEAHASGAASTVSGAGQQWSVVTARTLGAGGNMLEGGIGFPGVHAGYWRGVLQALDLGVRVSVNYGWEGQIDTVWPGVKLQALARYKFFDNGKVNLGANFAPGPMFYFPRGRTEVGFAMPVGLTLGIVASSALNVGVTFEIPMWIRFGVDSSLVLPVLMGAGLEYFLTSALAVWFDLRMGPSIWTNGNHPTVFTFDGKLGVGWRF
jgi:hypothetical protein